MNTEKFTTGEWRAVIKELLEDDHNCDVYDSNNNCVCECFSSGRWGDETGISEQQKESNMYLIAAAQEMYALLSIILSPTAMMSQQFRDEGLRTAIENVLKKARGEEWHRKKSCSGKPQLMKFAKRGLLAVLRLQSESEVSALKIFSGGKNDRRNT